MTDDSHIMREGDPTPLWRQVPPEVLDRACFSEGSELGLGFFCFETFYQAVVLSVPKDSSIIDIGGYQGVQGWLFSDFARYVDVDSYDVWSDRREWPVPERCELPANGEHLVMSGQQWFDEFSDRLPENAVVICSAVPDAGLRQLIETLPNHIVWYPGCAVSASGIGADAFVEHFACLQAHDENGFDFAARNERFVEHEFFAQQEAGLRDERGRFVGDAAKALAKDTTPLDCGEWRSFDDTEFGFGS